jgi:hypothetical protein
MLRSSGAAPEKPEQHPKACGTRKGSAQYNKSPAAAPQTGLAGACLHDRQLQSAARANFAGRRLADITFDVHDPLIHAGNATGPL